MRAICRFIVLVLVLGAGPASAHQAALAVMSVTETQPGVYALAWDNRPTASEGDDYLSYDPIWPEGCAARDLVLDCRPGRLEGEVGFEALGVGQSAAMLKIRDLAGTTQVLTLTPTAPTARAQTHYDPSGWSGRLQIATSYTALGAEHILIGIDHLMFVLGLIWIAATRWRLVRTITAFTAAHSVTLTAVSFGWIGVPEAFVNAMIALSIVFVGVEVVRRDRGETSLTLERPEIVAFGFGLLHGFGFAAALVALGLPEGARLLALAAFNVGVEIGQIGFVFLCLALAWAWRETTAPLPRRPALPMAFLIGGIAAFWFAERTAILLTT